VTGGSNDQISNLNSEIKYLKSQNEQLQEEINRRYSNKLSSPPSNVLLAEDNTSRANATEFERKMKEMSVELDCLRADNHEVRLKRTFELTY